MPNGYTQTGVNESTGQRDWSQWQSPFTGTGLPAPPGNQPWNANVPYGPGADDAAAMYHSLFGTTTPQQRATQGLPPTGDVTMPAGAIDAGTNRFANGGGANNAPSEPKSTPQQAGQNNSDYPGWSNGNQEVGVAKSETGQSDSTPLANRTATDPLNVALTTADAGLPAPPTAQTAAPATTETKSAQATGSEQAPGGSAQTVITPPANNWGFNIEGHGPSTPLNLVDAQGNPLTFASNNMTDAERVMFAVADRPYVRQVVQALSRLVYGGVGQPAISAGSEGNPHYAGQVAKAQEMEAYLNSIGVNWHPVSTYQEHLNSNSGGPNQDGGTGGETGGDSGLPPVSNAQDRMTQAWGIVNRLMGGGSNDPKYRPFMAEMAMAVAQMLQDQENQQQGVDIYGRAINDVKNDPRRAAEGSIIDAILAQPDNTPWDAVRAQTIAGSKRDAGAAADMFARNATRRLGSAGAAAAPGVASEMYRRSGNELENVLAQQRIQQAAGERQAQDRALSLSQGYRASTVDQDAERARALAAMVMGRPDVGPNPMSDAANAWTGSNYFNKAMNQGTGSQFGWQDALGTLTGLIGGTSTGMGAGGAGASGLGAILPLLGI